MNVMEYKGYFGTVTFDDEGGIFFGRVSNLQSDGITFEGSSVEGLRAAFRVSVDDYLAWCAERGETPDKPYSGKFNVRIPPELHARAASKAQAKGESLNEFVRKAIEHEVGA
ncbi:MAG TPA: type II toxin-antitoxin system HicB family antitoxin [Rectinemataceae bacterium]|nr:type II toxin-antitoxin system HicB family antitoxin [Rectinemataceae bacterium]